MPLQFSCNLKYVIMYVWDDIGLMHRHTRYGIWYYKSTTMVFENFHKDCNLNWTTSDESYLITLLAYSSGQNSPAVTISHVVIYLRQQKKKQETTRLRRIPRSFGNNTSLTAFLLSKFTEHTLIFIKTKLIKYLHIE